jgi:Na+-translocating ferredoxin:NAD+ oxidoreductase RnfG subunit
MTLIGLVSLVCWGLVAIPYWIITYPEQLERQRSADRALQTSVLPPDERSKAQLSEYERSIRKVQDSHRNKHVLWIGIRLGVVALIVSAVWFAIYRHKNRLPKN